MDEIPSSMFTLSHEGFTDVTLLHEISFTFQSFSRGLLAKFHLKDDSGPHLFLDNLLLCPFPSPYVVTPSLPKALPTEAPKSEHPKM
jgi:hypothetical protein